MDKALELLYFPALAAAAAALVVYVVQLLEKKRAIRVALETEINAIVADVRENRDFLERDDHYWLQPGRSIPFSPRPFPGSTKIYTSLLPELPLIGATDLQRVLGFYRYYETCENLRASLFAHVARFVETGSPLTAADVDVLRKRRNRLCAAYRHLEAKLPRVVALRHLSRTYELPAHQDLASAIHASLQDGAPTRPSRED